VTFYSILFEERDDRASRARQEAPEYFRDLNLDQIIEAITAGNDDYDLKPFFHDSLKTTEAVSYRHEVFRDLEDSQLLGCIKSFASRTQQMRQKLTQAKKLHYKQQKQRWFLHAVKLYCAAVHDLGADLSRLHVASRGLLAFRDHVARYLASGNFSTLVETATTLAGDLAAIRYATLITGTGFEVRKYDSERDYSEQVTETFKKFQQGAVKDYRVDFAGHADMNHIEAKILEFVALLFPEIFAALDRFCLQNQVYADALLMNFDREEPFRLRAPLSEFHPAQRRQHLADARGDAAPAQGHRRPACRELRAEGFRTLFAVLSRELSDDYFETIPRHLRQLKFLHGTMISAQLGEGNKGIGYVLREENTPEGTWMTRLFTPGPPSYTFHLPERDEAGAWALSELRDRGINLVANASAQSTDHILSFFNMLRTELAFYVGCLNLHGLAAKGEPMCVPKPANAVERRHAATGLYDVCLALSLGTPIVGNDLDADDKSLVIITGANQGGKSTFLRSVGLAQLMMQCGMFAPAEAFHANVCERIFTHYKREEDAAMNSGKLDEELSRMSDIIDDVVPNSMVLFNESFASTNEREGAEIARQIVTALVEQGVEVFFVSHQYEFAHAFEGGTPLAVLFLRAARQADGSRTFKLTEGRPLRTSYGEDLYKRIFIDAAQDAEVPLNATDR